MAIEDFYKLWDTTIVGLYHKGYTHKKNIKLQNIK